mmetsp:Transcript_58447/g.170945  ORF Transcript_58447/g.170945 Transcript_58447/m.170945 type:complete len:651 (+) Transcript_58447:81-2033(+)
MQPVIVVRAVSEPLPHPVTPRTPELPAHVNTRELMINPPRGDVPIDLSATALPPASLTFNELSFSVPLPHGKQQAILEPCWGHFDPGQLVALMGPSGCGKSTLLDMLAMKKTSKYSGEVLVNGHPRSPDTFQRIAAYVGQEDVMPAHWTVREAVEFNVRLKQQELPRAKRQETVDTLLQAFGLREVSETYIGGTQVRGISGGQRRRVSLARGVASRASILFCDEPTSGLSATDAELCVTGLRIVAKRLGVLVVVVIHQPRPEVAKLFDTLVLMTSKPGRMTYFGPMADALRYVEECGCRVPDHANPMDILMDLVTPGTEIDASEVLAAVFSARQHPAILEQVARAAALKGMTVEDMLNAACTSRQETQGSHAAQGRVRPAAAPFRVQFAALLRRKLRITLRNPMAIGLQLGLPVVMGFLLGLVFNGIGKDLESMSVIAFVSHVVPFIFILLTMLGLQSMPVMPLLVESRGFMKHEVSEALYTEAAAVLVSFCVDVPLSLFSATIQTVIIYLFSGLPLEHFGTVVFWCVLVFFFFDGLFSLVAAVAADAQQAQTMATPFVSIFMIFNGFIVSKEAAPAMVRWIFSVSPTFYGLQATVAAVAGSLGSGEMVLGQFMFSDEANGFGIMLICVFTVALRVLQTLALSKLNNIQK